MTTSRFNSPPHDTMPKDALANGSKLCPGQMWEALAGSVEIWYLWSSPLCDLRKDGLARLVFAVCRPGCLIRADQVIRAFCYRVQSCFVFVTTKWYPKRLGEIKSFINVVMSCKCSNVLCLSWHLPIVNWPVWLRWHYYEDLRSQMESPCLCSHPLCVVPKGSLNGTFESLVYMLLYHCLNSKWFESERFPFLVFLSA